MISCRNDYLNRFSLPQYIVWESLFLTLSTESFPQTAGVVFKAATALKMLWGLSAWVGTYTTWCNFSSWFAKCGVTCSILSTNVGNIWLLHNIIIEWDIWRDGMSCTPAPYTRQSCSDQPSHKSWIWRTGTWANKRPWRTVASAWWLPVAPGRYSQ